VITHRLQLIGVLALTLAASAGCALHAQGSALPLSANVSAAELHALVAGLTVTPRVLIIGMHPDDEDSRLIAWLSLGRHVETAYLSVTRGEAGANYGGEESATAVGAIRTQELLAERRMDGAQQFFTHAFDFGFARTAEEALSKHWMRDSVVGDIVAVIRAFRPHVIIAMYADSARNQDGQHQALAVLADQAFISSMDTRRFPASRFGQGWPVAKLYNRGPDLRIQTAEFDRVLGTTYAQIGLESRAQQRSQGLRHLVGPETTMVTLARVASRIRVNGRDETSIFDGIDTTMMRLVADAPLAVGLVVPQIVANADSARRALDGGSTAAAILYLARVARMATSARAATPWCRHPSASAAPPADVPTGCAVKLLDLDASIDLVRERSTAALLAASGVSFTAMADRDLLATRDTLPVTVTMYNHGAAPATFADVALWGGVDVAMTPIVVPPDSAVAVVRSVTGLADPRPWWIVKRQFDRFAEVVSSVDGVARGMMVPMPLTASSVTVPENMRRTSDATVTVTLAGATVTTSLGPVIHRYADAKVGLQNRPLAGVPDVTLRFERVLEWLPSKKPIARTLRLALTSHSDRVQEFALRAVLPKGVRVDSLPKLVSLQPHEQRDLYVQLRGRLERTDRAQFGIVGVPSGEAGEEYQSGYQTVQREYLPPIRFFRSSGVYLQPVDITVPANLTVVYVPGIGDDVLPALKQIGVWTASATSAEQLMSIDVSKVSTVVIGPRAIEAQPELLAQSGRVMDFVRKGGTLVVMRGDSATAASALFPYRMTVLGATSERVSLPSAAVTVLDPKSRLLAWPNAIKANDWEDWAGDRAQWVPSVVDARYATPLEMHDPEQKENRNALVSSRVGKGVVVYTTLTLDQQIAAGVPGGLRLFVNLLSAGLVP
jgi:LmbE family N-acetylglucosaminyl deacetylase